MACDACVIYSFLSRLATYFAILALLVTISYLILKCIGDWRERSVEEVGESESNHLVSRNYATKTITTSYGACQQDLELGICSYNNGCSSSNNNNSCGKYIEELYDAKICVICYDELRNCFFVPCGHCATCHMCAQRIFHEENRSCPVCRRFIGKIRRLSSSLHDHRQSDSLETREVANVGLIRNI